MHASSTTQRQHPDALRLLTAVEVADLIGGGVNPRTVLRMSAAGRLPRVDLGHRIVRFRLADVVALINASTKNESHATNEALGNNSGGRARYETTG